MPITKVIDYVFITHHRLLIRLNPRPEAPLLGALLLTQILPSISYIYVSTF